MNLRTSDPLEQLLEKHLILAGIPYLVDGEEGNKTGLDFYLPDDDVYIEIKRFCTDRTAEQMSRVANIVVAQGPKAVAFLAGMLVSDALSKEG